MADPVKQFCDETGVFREEALFYLEGFEWDSDAAMEACRSKTLPPFTVKSSPGISVNDKYASNSRLISNPSEEQHKSIKKFYEVAAGATLEEAVSYLQRRNWNVNLAVGDFMDEQRPMASQNKSNSQLKSSAVSQRIGLTGVKIGSSSSSSMEVDLTEAEKSLNKAGGEEHITEAIPLMASSQVNLPNSPKEKLSQLNDKLISLFCEAAGGATRKEAIYCLNLCNWDVNQAVNYCLDQRSHGVFSKEETTAAMVMMMMKEKRGNQCYLKEGEIWSSSSLVNADPTETGRPFKEAGEENVTVAIPGIAMSQVVKNWKREAVDEDSSTATYPDPFAIQERIIVGPRAGLITTAIKLQIILADGWDGEPVDIFFRSDQTVRDIRNAIDEFRPDDNRDYYLMSGTGEIYDDLNITVHGISSRGSTELIQIFNS